MAYDPEGLFVRKRKHPSKYLTSVKNMLQFKAN